MDFEKQPPTRREQMRAAAGWTAFIAQSLAASVEVFMHRQFGARYLGGQAAAVIPVILVFTLFWKGHDVTPLWGFLGLYLVVCAYRRTEIVRRTRRGDAVHSYYSGQPDILRWPVFKGRLSERKAKGVIEPLMVFFWGLFLMPVNEPLGGYLMLAAAGLLTSVQMAYQYERKRLMDMRDAFLEQRHFADRFRDGSGRRR